MKTPLTTEPIVIHTWSDTSQEPGYFASATVGSKKLKATSTGTCETAARNLALRIFWGGNTNHYAGPEERAAVELEQLRMPGGFRARLNLPA